MRNSVLLCGSLLCGTLLPAQTTGIFPPYAATRDGYGSNYRPIVANGVVRGQQIFDKALWTLPNNAAITKIGWRQDSENKVASPGYSLQLEMLMSPSTRTFGTVSSTFASNYKTGSTQVTVFAKKIFALPAMAAPTTNYPTPSPTKTMIPLDTPYTHNTADSLLVEFKVYANTNANQGFNYYVDVDPHYTTKATYGTGCTNSVNKKATVSTDTPPLGQYWYITQSNGVPTAPTAMLLGTSDQTWNSTPLPFDLGVIGAPTCLLYNNMIYAPGAIANSAGGAGFYLPLPNDVAFDGLTLHVQTAQYDPFGNNLGVVTSSAAKATFGFPTRGYSVVAVGNVAATTGGVDQNYGVVTLFEY